GPLYFIYKILSTIKLAQNLSKDFPENNFVPLFWLASEDHDIAEIDHFHLWNNTYKWNMDQKGATGRLHTSGLIEILNELKPKFGENANANELSDIFEKAYAQPDLSKATRMLVHELFREYGLIVIDSDDTRLKAQFSKIVEK